MSLRLDDLDAHLERAVRHFWTTRTGALQASGEMDTGNRGAVTAGKNLDGFYALLRAIVVANGLPDASVYCGAQELRRLRHTILPGFYRPSKSWDVLVRYKGELVAAVELKSQVGSFGNNFNNRAEEVVGMGEDLRVAFREGLLGGASRPFVGYLMVLEDAPASRTPVSVVSRHFDPDDVFQGASYAQRYEVLCSRLVREGLYDDAAAVLLTSSRPEALGQTTELSLATGMRAFATRLAARVSEAVARG